MAALAHDREVTREQQGVGQGRRPALCLAPEAGRSEGRCRAALAVVAVVVLMAVGGSLANAAAGAAGARPPVAEASSVPSASPSAVRVVQPGQTYWSIAEEQGGSGDIRARVSALQEANAGRPLRVGDRLVVPQRE